MAYVILFFKDGAEIGQTPSAAPQSVTIEAAPRHMATQGASFAKVIHEDTGVVVWEGTREA